MPVLTQITRVSSTTAALTITRPRFERQADVPIDSYARDHGRIRGNRWRDLTRCIADTQSAAGVDPRDRVTTCTQRSDQSADPAIPLFQRGKIAQLAANVDRKPVQFQTVKHRQTIVDVRHVGDRDAEFVFLLANRDFGMRADIDIGFTRNTAGAAISASVLPTPENTMSSDRIPASSARRNSPPDTISAPNRD